MQRPSWVVDRSLKIAESRLEEQRQLWQTLHRYNQPIHHRSSALCYKIQPPRNWARLHPRAPDMAPNSLVDGNRHIHVKNGHILYRVAYQRSTYHVLRSEEHTSELQSRGHLVCRLLLE